MTNESDVGLTVAAEPSTAKEKGRYQMSAGTLIFLLLIGGGLFAMFSMHRGGSHSHGMGGGCGGGHGHTHGSSEEPRAEEEKKPLLGKPGSHGHDREPAAADDKRGGC